LKRKSDSTDEEVVKKHVDSWFSKKKLKVDEKKESKEEKEEKRVLIADSRKYFLHI
jgi:hypothetical protein